MTGPMPAPGTGQVLESPRGGRPSQSETAVTLAKGRALGTVTGAQELHAAHLVHVLEAHKHKAAHQLPALTSQQQPDPSRLMESLLAVDSPSSPASEAASAAGSQQWQSSGREAGGCVCVCVSVPKTAWQWGSCLQNVLPLHFV